MTSSRSRSGRSIQQLLPSRTQHEAGLVCNSPRQHSLAATRDGRKTAAHITQGVDHLGPVRQSARSDPVWPRALRERSPLRLCGVGGIAYGCRVDTGQDGVLEHPKSLVGVPQLLPVRAEPRACRTAALPHDECVWLRTAPPCILRRQIS